MEDILIACHCKKMHHRIVPLSKSQPIDFYKEDLFSPEVMERLNIRSISFIDTDPDCQSFHEEPFHQYTHWEEIPENSFDKIFEINCPYGLNFEENEGILSKILKPNGHFYATKTITFRPNQQFMVSNPEEAIHWPYYIDSENNIAGYLGRGIELTKILQRPLKVLTNQKDLSTRGGGSSLHHKRRKRKRQQQSQRQITRRRQRQRQRHRQHRTKRQSLH